MNPRRRILFASLSFGALALAACGGSSGGGTPADGGVGGSGAFAGSGASGGSGGTGGTGGFVGNVDKLDLLFMVDNSISMADKQELLAQAVPELVKRLVTPRCLDTGGHPTGASAPCPAGSEPELKPLTDIHIGVVSSSLGAHGGDICDSSGPGANPTWDDHAHLLGSVRPGLSSFQSLGFLSWDPDNKEGGSTDANQLIADFSAHVTGAGESGCGYEASLESWYRFLIDPEPPAGVVQQGGFNTITGVDQTVLQQRAAFLRPDSLVAIVMLTDENDCSIVDGGAGVQGQGWVVTTSNAGLPRATSVCATNPDDACCFSCAQGDTPGCPPVSSDPECLKGTYDQYVEDPLNLRCWDQKRRFGVDWLYPTQRYVDGLTKPQIKDRSGQMVPNPLFAGGRDPYLVYLVGIVGVPWQLLATDASLTDPNALEYKSASQLEATGVWPKITPTGSQPPTDPHMLESRTPRAGLPGPSSAPGADPISGHEWTPSSGSDLMYACIYPLPTPKDCSVNEPGCACPSGSDGEKSPLCQAPGGSYGNTQYYAKAYPGVRHLEVLRDLGDQGVVASICPKLLGDASNPSSGYNPAIDALVLRLRHLL